jgi:asparagine synthase (glutamine-hydrolysing)
MCGLFFTNVEADEIGLIKPFIEKRGRDETNIFSKAQYKYLHSRLAINNFGLVQKQPIILKNGALTILFNGEIYNFKELSSQYYGCQDINDTTLLGKLIADHGVYHSIPKLNGMYSIVVHDHETGRIYCARDQFGQKPLFYSQRQNRLRISSSIQALARLERSSPSESAFKVYASYGYFACPDTAYEGIAQFVPGTITELEVATGDIVATTPITYKGNLNTNRTLEFDEFLSVFEDTASRHVFGDAHSCLLLSGGVDSSLVSTFMAEHGVTNSFSVGFKDHKQFDETADAVAVASVLGLKHTVLDYSPDEYFQQIQQLNSIYEQPFGDSSALPTSLMLHTIAGEGYKVAFGGDGGDELFFGYQRHRKFGDIYHLMPIIKKFLKAADHFKIKIENNKMERLIDLSCTTSPSSFILNTRNLSRNIFDYSYLHHKADNKKTFTEILKYFDILSIFSNDLMVKTDRPSMHSGIEVRSPLLDFEVNALSDYLIRNDKLFYRKNKNLLKKIIHAKNKDVLRKPNKKGFSVPVDIWIRDEWKDWATDLMNSFIYQRKFDYDYAAVQLIFNNHMSGKQNSRDYIWSILMYQNWIESI